uniref:Uncharacterized protein n=1 Tax=Strongyloides venezuelensis TaxID=75913 RepID=A0A0K0F6Z9_STRVS
MEQIRLFFNFDLNLTSNYVESFNSIFGRMIEENHPTINKLIECLKLQEYLTNNEINKRLLNDVSEAIVKKNEKWYNCTKDLLSKYYENNITVNLD